MLKNNYPYAVIVRYDFDDDMGVYPCKDESQAKDLLKRFFEAEVAEDKANGHDFEAEISDDGWSATITNYRRDCSIDHTWWKIGNVYGEGDDFA